MTADDRIKGPTLSISAVAAQFGVHADTLRYYERTGVLPQPPRDSAGRRAYDAHAVHLIGILLHLKRTGMPLAQIAQFTHLVAQDPDGVPERLALLRAHRTRVSEQIDAWAQSMAVIEKKIRDYERRG